MFIYFLRQTFPKLPISIPGALSGRPDSLDYDSGARDLQSPEPFVSLGRLIESHDPALYREVTEVNSVGQRLMDLANRVSFRALDSLRAQFVEYRETNPYLQQNCR